MWGSNSQPRDHESHALPTEPVNCLLFFLFLTEQTNNYSKYNSNNLFDYTYTYICICLCTSEIVVKNQLLIFWLEETHFKYRDTYQLIVKEYRNKYHANIKQMRMEVAELIPDKTDSKARKIIRKKDKCYIMMKGPVIQEEITIPNAHVPHKKA